MTKIGFFSLLILYSFACSKAQDPSDCYSEHLRFKHEQELHFASEEESPLTEEDRMRFRSLNYFEFDERYCMEAEWVRTEGEEPFEMAAETNTAELLMAGVEYSTSRMEIPSLSVLGMTRPLPRINQCFISFSPFIPTLTPACIAIFSEFSSGGIGQEYL